jgi:hypothetical protein
MPGKDTTDDDKEKWDGDPTKLDDFDKRMGRWCRKQFGTRLGNDLWGNQLPDFDLLVDDVWDDYCEVV